MTGTRLDPRTPVFVGVGQSSQTLTNSPRKPMSAVDLAVEAARGAIGDTGADPASVASAIDTVAGVRQFEISTPDAVSPLGRSSNYPRSVADGVGATPRRAILEVSGGQSPQHLATEIAASIAAGECEVALIFGAEAMSTDRACAGDENAPDFTEHVEGNLEDRGYGLKGLMSADLARHGLVGAPTQYALFENARRARLGLTREEYAADIGLLFAPFTAVAAANPHAAAPTERSAKELVTPTQRNRPIADPYTRFVVARDQVNQGAAVVVMSVAAARRLGVAEEKWVYLHGHADVVERRVIEREDLSSAPASVLAVQRALDVAGIGLDDLTTIDLYSCFPIAVFALCDGLGLATDDPRGLTVTGGLPFFGGPGNNYSMHAIAETVVRVRDTPGGLGLVGANGGLLSKYSAGIYSTAPASWQQTDDAYLQVEVDSWPAVAHATDADGWARVETFTINHGSDGKIGIVVGRLEADNRRFVANVIDGDQAMIERLETDEPIGSRVFVRSTNRGNRVSTTEAAMRRLLPTPEPCLRDDYEFTEVRRDGHVLEIVINRQHARNSLHPPANDELEEIFDAFFSDPDLWVAILTGAGDKAFCAGNDLVYSAAGKPMWMPRTGFGGLTSRRGMNKPVIAAVNGFAMGGGCEIALACHLVVADDSATFALSEVRVGLVAGAGGLVRLPRAVPEKLATEMILTGKRLNAREALAQGLVNRVVETGQALAGARQLATEILAGSPTSVRTSLEIMAQTQGVSDTVEAAALPSPAIDDLLSSEDMREGMLAFAEKRAPRWKNR